jgi:hypothetical protein
MAPERLGPALNPANRDAGENCGAVNGGGDDAGIAGGGRGSQASGAVMIRVCQHPDENTHSANNGCVWVAEAIVSGISYSARSRHGASQKLARVFVDANIPAPMQVTTAGLRGETTYRSFHAMAGRTFKENAQTPVKRSRGG